MGSMKSLLGMLPGFGSIKELDVSDLHLKRMESIILSMTVSERLGLEELAPGRRRRIARGSGRSLEEVNQMIKNFKRIKQMMKKMPAFKKKFSQGNLGDLSATLSKGNF